VDAIAAAMVQDVFVVATGAGCPGRERANLSRNNTVPSSTADGITKSHSTRKKMV